MSNTEDKTLCALQEEGYIESHTEDFKKLIQPARFFCQNWGRSAVTVSYTHLTLPTTPY